METISRYVASTLLENNFIKTDEYQACKYGLKKFLTSLSQIIFIFALSLILKKFFLTAVWLTAFIPLRIYGGGYHADTKLRCFSIFVSVYILFTITITFIPLNVWTVGIISIGTVVSVCVFAPLKHKNRHLNEYEIKNYRKTAILISLIECAIALILLYRFSKSSYTYAFSLGMLTATVSLLFGKVKNMTMEVKTWRK